MAMREHEFTNLKGEPVTICKDQSKEAKAKRRYIPVFLLPHPDYPDVKDISKLKVKNQNHLLNVTDFADLMI